MSCTHEEEPTRSEDSSPDERCHCGHTRDLHQVFGALGGAQCNQCGGDDERSWRHSFATEGGHEDSSPDVTEQVASKMVQTGIALLMEDAGRRGYLDLRHWLTSELDKAYQGGLL